MKKISVLILLNIFLGGACYALSDDGLPMGGGPLSVDSILANLESSEDCSGDNTTDPISEYTQTDNSISVMGAEEQSDNYIFEAFGYDDIFDGEDFDFEEDEYYGSEESAAFENTMDTGGNEQDTGYSPF